MNIYIKGVLNSSGCSIALAPKVNLTNIIPVSINPVDNNIIGEYNGFIFILKTEENSNFQVGDIKRKYAQAINQSGQVVLESDRSFASDPDILVEELKFTIDTQHLTS